MAEHAVDLAANPAAVAEALGMSQTGPSPCPLPSDDHLDQAWLEEREGYGLVLRCNCRQLEGAASCPTWTALSDVFRSIVTGELVQRQDLDPRCHWVLRLAHRAGLLEPARLGELPPNPTPAMRAVAEDVALLLAKSGGEPVRYAARYAAPRLELPKSTADDALRALLDAGVIVSAGLAASGWPRGTRLLAAPTLPSVVEREMREPGVVRMHPLGTAAVEPADERREFALVTAAVVEGEAGGGLGTLEGGASLHA